MGRRVTVILLFVMLACGPVRAASTLASSSDESTIRNVLDAQVEAWNHGDVVQFMQGYKNSPKTTFIGKSIQHGFATILGRYQKTYSNKEQMGQLSLANIDVNLLDPDVAVVTGQYHLVRNAAGGGEAGGVFSLVFQKGADGWKIVLDHTS